MDPVDVTLIARYIGSQEFYNRDMSVWGTLGAHHMFDARVDWRAQPGLKVWLRGTNLLDADAMARYSFPEPGRQLYAGVSYAWPN